METATSKRFLSTLAVALALAVTLGGSAAEPTVGDWRDRGGLADPQLRTWIQTTYLAVDTADQWHLQKGGDRIFCPPPNRLLTDEELGALIDKNINRPNSAADGVTLVVLLTRRLIVDFPCT